MHIYNCHYNLTNMREGGGEVGEVGTSTSAIVIEVTFFLIFG